eukprot:1330905-Prymnesium_polylepis.1
MSQQHALATMMVTSMGEALMTVSVPARRRCGPDAPSSCCAHTSNRSSAGSVAASTRPHSISRSKSSLPFLFRPQYEELTATGRAHVLSPHELERRFLVKGKVKLPKLKRSEKKTALTRRVSSYLNITKKGLARTGSCTGVIRRKSS